MEAKNKAFQILKPPCVRLSQAALALRGSQGNVKDVVDALTAVLSALEIASKDPRAINDKIADYVFFPLSHVLRQLERLPVRAKELTLSCISILLRTAWSTDLAPALGIQLLILLTFLADFKDTNAKGGHTSEELQSTTLVCLRQVFDALKESDDGRTALGSTANIPHIGKSVSTILDNIYEGTSATVQVAAVDALHSFILSLNDREALAVSFLPGMMSCLTKVLAPTTKSKRSIQVLERGLKVLTDLLPLVIGDDRTGKPILIEHDHDRSENPAAAKTWIEATAPQVKMSLVNIVKLQHHERDIVRQAVATLCISLISNCTQTLYDSIQMLLEVLTSLAASGDASGTELDQMLLNKPQLVEMLRASLLSWINTLPRVALQANDALKSQLLSKLTFAYTVLGKLHMDLSVIERAIGSNLRDTVLTMQTSSASSVSISEFPDGAANLQQLMLTSDSQSFSPIVLQSDAHIELTSKIIQLIEIVSEAENAPLLAEELMSSLLVENGSSSIATFWILLQLVRRATSTPALDLDSFIDLGPSLVRSFDDVLDQLYSFSIDLLTQGSAKSEIDWRMLALALETVALQATHQKEDFRPELVDALYPVLFLMGSTSPDLQRHAMTCLNILADACGYSNSGQLIVSNVDYLVNAVTIRLNTVDLSPQAPLVMLMMVKLAGPPLLPYLDDLVDSVFASLEAFHGYPKLVGLLFSVLKAVVEEGAKTPQLLLEATEEDSSKHRKRFQKSLTMGDLLSSIQNTQKNYASDGNDGLTDDTVFPTVPWETEQGGSTAGKLTQGQQLDDPEDGTKTTEADVAESGPPAAKVYGLMLNVSRLTEHFLASDSSELRIALLQLLQTTIPALSRHDNSFLPLINSTWPTVVHRLDDDEPYVVAEALTVIGEMCRFAGNFMKNRVEDVWPALLNLHHSRIARTSNDTRKINMGVVTELSGFSAGVTRTSKAALVPNERYYVQAPARIISAAFVEMLVRITEHVTVLDEVFDQIIGLLLPFADTRPDVKRALETRNPDALWLVQWKQGQHTLPDVANIIDLEVDHGFGAFNFVDV